MDYTCSNTTSPQLYQEKKAVLYSGEKEECAIDILAAVNWPTMMEYLYKDLLGYSNVDSNGLALNIATAC